jgi:hypothetical protein
MNEKDFELIAHTIAALNDGASDEEYFTPCQLLLLSKHFAKSLARTNPAFNKPVFIKACFKGE